MPTWIAICIGILIGWSLSTLIDLALGLYQGKRRHRAPRRLKTQEILDDVLGRRDTKQAE